MAITTSSSLIHWNYFLALENDFSLLSRYIEFSKKNFNTYSIELAHLLLASSSEVDVVVKTLCNKINPSRTHRNIVEYRETIRTHLPELIKEKCLVPRFGLELSPWSPWKGKKDRNPIWWRSYNNVKHERDQYFTEANLKHTLNSMAALAIANLYLQKENTHLTGPTRQFKMKNVTRLMKPDSELFKFKDEYYYSQVIT